MNDAFIITDEVRKKLIEDDPKSAEIIRPILRGRDIYRDRLDFHNLFLINSHNGYVSEDGDVVERIKIEEYPAVKNWLDNGSWNKMVDKISNIDRLTKRTDQGDTPYNLRSLAYMDDFSKLKIVFSRIAGDEAKFAMDDAGFVTNDTGYIITGESISYLQEQLTSPEMWFAFNKFYMGGGVSKEFKVNNLLALPVPKEGSSLIFTEEEKLVIKMWNQM
ncbi:MAG: TaqI-like C-terminal specificity domain-containing protein [Weissella cibaria]